MQHIGVWHERLEKNPDEIVMEHSELMVADIFAALAYYFDHRAAVLSNPLTSGLYRRIMQSLLNRLTR